MNVLILANSSSGLYQFRKELLESLLKKGHQVYFCVPKGDFVADLQQMGGLFIDTEISRHGTNPITDLNLLAKYLKIIRSVKPGIIFTYTIKPNIYGGIASLLCGVPYVSNITGLGTAVENEGVLQKITLALYKIGLCKSQKVFFQNQANQNFMLMHKVVKGAYSLLPGSGVNLKRFTPLPYPADDCGIHFVFIGRIMREKGIDQYLDAAEVIKQKYPLSKFHICGYCEKEYQGRLEELVARNLVIWHGEVRDIREILKNVHCTIHPSFYPEGISNVLLESSACARPIITTNRSGCREVVEDGVNGFVVKQRNSEDLIQKIEKFLALSHEQKMQMGLAGRCKVEREFDRKNVVDAYFKELEYVK